MYIYIKSYFLVLYHSWGRANSYQARPLCGGWMNTLFTRQSRIPNNRPWTKPVERRWCQYHELKPRMTMELPQREDIDNGANESISNGDADALGRWSHAWQVTIVRNQVIAGGLPRHAEQVSGKS